MGPINPAFTENEKLRVHFLDVGYADAILVEFPDGTNLLIDAGDKGTQDKVIRYLKNRNITKIDTAIITHPHANHFGGFLSLVNQIPIQRLFINGDTQAEEGYPELLKTFETKKIPVAVLRRGERLEPKLSGISLEILNPKTLGPDSNANSIALKLTYGKTSFLFLGDINEAVQKELAGLLGAQLHADCIQVPHHGVPVSETLAALFPAPFYVISTGPSRWGLPTLEEISRLKGKLFRTDEEGDIVFESNGKKITARKIS
jgi:beta-lactamase superfamily II metal-dependent hydrolase